MKGCMPFREQDALEKVVTLKELKSDIQEKLTMRQKEL
jgi:hypothetical protein